MPIKGGQAPAQRPVSTSEAGVGSGPNSNAPLNTTMIRMELMRRGFSNLEASKILAGVNTKNKLKIKLENNAGLNLNYKPTFNSANLPFSSNINKHAYRFVLSKLVRNANISSANRKYLKNIKNLRMFTVPELKNSIAQAKKRNLSGLKPDENVGSGVIRNAANGKYYYTNKNTGLRHEVTQNIGGALTGRWSATISSGGPLGALTGKKISFKYTKSSNGKAHFERLNKPENNNSKNKGMAAPAPATAQEENYSRNNVFNLLKKYTSVRNANKRKAIEKAMNAKLEQAVSNLKSKNTSYRITQYGEILRALHARDTFPGRSIIIGSIRNDIRRAAKSSNAKYEMERIKKNLKLNLLPTRDRNIRETFNDEFRILKNRERRYERAYGGRNNNYGGIGGLFGGGKPPRPRFNMGGPRFNMGGPPPRYNSGPAPRYNNIGPGAPPPAPARPQFNITGAPPPRINLPPVNIGTAAAPASNRTGALPVNLPANEATAIKQLGGVNAAANKINQAGGPTNVAKTANALQKAGGNQNRAVAEFGADPKALKLVIEVAGPTRNYNKVNNALNGLNKVATKIRHKRKRVTKKRVVTATKKRVTKKRVTKKRVVKKRIVRTGELNKLLHAVTKNTILRRLNNANVVKKTLTKNEAANMYRNFLTGENLKK
jgi:hypothetical protein